jgi:hypothetical protein
MLSETLNQTKALGSTLWDVYVVPPAIKIHSSIIDCLQSNNTGSSDVGGEEGIVDEEAEQDMSEHAQETHFHPTDNVYDEHLIGGHRQAEVKMLIIEFPLNRQNSSYVRLVHTHTPIPLYTHAPIIPLPKSAYPSLFFYPFICIEWPLPFPFYSNNITSHRR